MSPWKPEKGQHLILELIPLRREVSGEKPQPQTPRWPLGNLEMVGGLRSQRSPTLWRTVNCPWFPRGREVPAESGLLGRTSYTRLEPVRESPAHAVKSLSDLEALPSQGQSLPLGSFGLQEPRAHQKQASLSSSTVFISIRPWEESRPYPSCWTESRPWRPGARRSQGPWRKMALHGKSVLGNWSPAGLRGRCSRAAAET